MRKKVFVVLSLVGMLSVLAPGLSSDAAWKSDSQGRYYTANTDRGYLTGWKKIGKYKYYFDKDKYAATGWRYMKGNWYYFDVKGRMLTNIWVDGSYLTRSGKMARNTVINGIRVDADGNQVSTDSGINDGSENASSDDRERKNIWVQNDGKWYYYNYKGKLAKGIMTIKNHTYYLDASTGERKTGIIRLNRKYYFFDPQTGIQQTGWITYNNNTYYFSKKTKAALKGWQKISRKYYYFNSKRVLQRNAWISKKYYVDGSGRRVYGWATIGNSKYYLNPSTGIKVKGLKKIGNYYYYFNSAGRMMTNKWIKKRYFQASGKMARKKWVDDKYVNSSGYVSKTRKVGFYTENGKTYYLKSDYNLAKNGWMQISGKWYYFDAKGVLLKSTWQDGYYVDDKGVRVVNGFYTVSRDTFLFKEDGTIAKGWTDYNGKRYYFDPSTGAMKTGFQLLDGNNYYFDPKTGVMAANEVKIIGDSVYTFDASGIATLDATNYAKGKAIADYAQQFVGYPYLWGGREDLTKGVDCSGFTYLVFKHFGYAIPSTTSQAQALGNAAQGGPYAEAKFVSIKELLPGDLLFYDSDGIVNNHVAIYIGDGKIVHASNSQPYPKGGIKISNYDYSTIKKIVRYW